MHVLEFSQFHLNTYIYSNGKQETCIQIYAYLYKVYLASSSRVIASHPQGMRWVIHVARFLWCLYVSLFKNLYKHISQTISSASDLYRDRIFKYVLRTWKGKVYICIGFDVVVLKVTIFSRLINVYHVRCSISMITLRRMININTYISNYINTLSSIYCLI